MATTSWLATWPLLASASLPGLGRASWPRGAVARGGGNRSHVETAVPIGASWCPKRATCTPNGGQRVIKMLPKRLFGQGREKDPFLE